MIRGLSWALASSTTSNREEDRNTMKVQHGPGQGAGGQRTTAGGPAHGKDRVTGLATSGALATKSLERLGNRRLR
jgi:hypothetical protein